MERHCIKQLQQEHTPAAVVIIFYINPLSLKGGYLQFI